ncbi:MAG: universal stress protein [Gammaproteobacteria bacterium]|nr:universal stress protein [Gammaproteobacteria bacterium]
MKRFKKILFVANSKLRNDDAFERAVTLAEHNQSELTVVSVMEELPENSIDKIQSISMTKLRDSLLEQKYCQLEAMVSSIGDREVPIKIKVLTGVAFLTLIQEVLSNNIDLLIKTVDEEGVFERLFGSSDMHLLRKCPCPVWLIKSSKYRNYQKIMVAIDFDPIDPTTHNTRDYLLNQQLLEMSIALALSDFSELHIVHAWQAYGEDRLRSGLAYQPKAYVDSYVERIHKKQEVFLNKIVADVIDKTGKEIAHKIEPKIHLLKGLAKDRIPEIVKDQKIDLIIMGTVGRTGIPGFIIGNTAETVLSRINCSVLAIKPEGFVTPVSL